MLEFEKQKFIWDYDIPQSIEYIIEVHDDCELCQNTEIKNWSSQFIASNVPYDQLMKVLERFFGFITTPEIIEYHKNHIKTKIITDNELQTEFKEQMKLIESDIPKQIDEKRALESLIRGLYGRKLFLEKTNEYGKEYAMITQQLKQSIELKLRMKDELKEASEKTTLKDVIKLFEVTRRDNVRNEPTITAERTWVRDGTRESVKHFVRIEKYKHISSSGIYIPNTN